MPYIATTTNVKLSNTQRGSLKRRMGKAISLIPGKSESWLMLSWKDEVPMAFQGLEDPCAVCEVKLYGSASARDYDALTAALCSIMHDEAGIPADRIYVTYQEISTWGFDGSNF